MHTTNPSPLYSHKASGRRQQGQSKHASKTPFALPPPFQHPLTQRQRPAAAGAGDAAAMRFLALVQGPSTLRCLQIACRLWVVNTEVLVE